MNFYLKFKNLEDLINFNLKINNEKFMDRQDSAQQVNIRRA